MFNPYVVVPFVVWAVAQFLKFTLAALRGQIDFRYLYASGGMPSVHSAVVTSLAVTALLVDGPYSAIFGLTVIFAAIVMYDSFGVRRSAGEQAVAINGILDSLDRNKLERPTPRLREILGHRPLEVTIGAILGLLLGGLLNYGKLGPILAVVTIPVMPVYTYVLAVVAGAILIGGTVFRVVLLRRYRKVEIAEKAVRRGSWLAWTVGLIGLVLAFLQYEQVSAALWVVWPILYVALVVIAGVLMWWPYRASVPAALAEHQEQLQKQRWFEGPNKKRRAKTARSKKRK